MKPIRLFLVESEETLPLVLGEKFLREAGLLAEVQAVYGEAGRWVSVWLREATYGMHVEVQRRALVGDGEKGFRLEPSLLPAMRAEVLIERWEGLAGEAGAEGFLALAPVVAAALDAEIQARVYPNVMGDPRFFDAWTARRKQSEERMGTSGESRGGICIPA